MKNLCSIAVIIIAVQTFLPVDGFAQQPATDKRLGQTQPIPRNFENGVRRWTIVADDNVPVLAGPHERANVVRILKRGERIEVSKLDSDKYYILRDGAILMSAVTMTYGDRLVDMTVFHQALIDSKEMAEMKKNHKQEDSLIVNVKPDPYRDKHGIIIEVARWWNHIKWEHRPDLAKKLQKQWSAIHWPEKVESCSIKIMDVDGTVHARSSPDDATHVRIYSPWP